MLESGDPRPSLTIALHYGSHKYLTGIGLQSCNVESTLLALNQLHCDQVLTSLKTPGPGQIPKTQLGETPELPLVCETRMKYIVVHIGVHRWVLEPVWDCLTLTLMRPSDACHCLIIIAAPRSFNLLLSAFMYCHS